MKARSVAFKIENAVLIAAVIVVNALAVLLPLNGRSTAAISDTFPSLFVPANYVFSIWSLIYLFLIGFGIFQFLPSQGENPYLRAADWWFGLSCLVNIAWIFAWHYGMYGLSLFVMLLLFLFLAIIYSGLRLPGRKLPPPTVATRILVHLPFSIYMGWITVAMLANTSDVLAWVGVRWLGTAGEAAVLCIVAGAVSVIISIIHRDIAFTAVIIWALVGIIQKQAAHPLIVLASWVAIGLAAAGLGIGFLRPRRRIT